MTPELRPSILFITSRNVTSRPTCFSVEDVPRKTRIPADVDVLVFGHEHGQLRLVEGVRKIPEVVNWPQEKDISINVNHGVDMLEVALEQAAMRNNHSTAKFQA